MCIKKVYGAGVSDDKNFWHIPLRRRALMPTNKSIIEKADIAVSNLMTTINSGASGTGGYLNPMQSNVFIRKLMDQPTIVNAIRVVPMNSPQMLIDKIGFTSRILKASPGSGTALAPNNRSRPVTEQVTLNTTEVIAEVHLPYDVMEDNIERNSLEDTVMAMMTERVSVDLEEWVITADTGSGDTFLALKDGLLVQATSHIVDYSDSNDRSITKEVFKNGYKALPNKYKRLRANLVFWSSHDIEIEYDSYIATRTTNLGDSKFSNKTQNHAMGIPVVPVSLMPVDKYILTYPKNVILGVQRQIMIETERDIRARNLVVVVTLRMDLKFEEEDAVVKCVGLNPNEDTPTTTTT